MTCGISTGFPVLSPAMGQVAHVLLTRSPLGTPLPCGRRALARLACVRRAASVNPEPGSNSPSKDERPKGLVALSRVDSQSLSHSSVVKVPKPNPCGWTLRPPRPCSDGPRKTGPRRAHEAFRRRRNGDCIAAHLLFATLPNRFHRPSGATAECSEKRRAPSGMTRLLPRTKHPFPGNLDECPARTRR
jgi:hypothetical protein